MSTVPWRVDDGAFSTALAVGRPEISYPFADEGDITSRVLRQKYRQDGRYFSAQPIMSRYLNGNTTTVSIPFTHATNPNARNEYVAYNGGYLDSQGRFRNHITTDAKVIGEVLGGVFIPKGSKMYLSATGGGGSGDSNLYLVDEGPTNDIGSGIIEWWRTYATVPITRSTGATIAYTEQYGVTGDGTILEMTFTKAATIIWQYSLAEPSILYAPRIVPGPDGSGYRFIGGIAAWRARIAGKNILASDQERGIYKGKIYYLKSILVDMALDFTGSVA